jgi:L-asparaginase
MLHTGGTLAMEGKRPQPLHCTDFERTLREQVPELSRMAQIEFEVFSNLDSSDMQPALWSSLAQSIHARLSHVDGVVVTHGTDTMAWTASALSFMLRGLSTPVVLTGAQRPLGEIRTDARLNLIDAVTAAISGPPEVCICFGSRVYRGNRALKIKINDYDAFDSPNFPPLGSLGVDVTWARRSRLGSHARPRLLPRLQTQVFLLKIFPGIPPAVARSILPGLRGLVVQGFGAGNFPIEGAASLLPLLDEARDRKIPTIMVSQARYNPVDLSLYEAGAAALERGVIGGGDMTPETALVKLMHVLAYVREPRRVRAQLEADLVGERTPG